MWIVGLSCGEPRTPLKIDLPPGTYLVPRAYDRTQLAALARLLGNACPKVRDAVVITWHQADALEALGRCCGDGHRSDALWALHGPSGEALPAGGQDLKALIAKRFPCMQPRWVLILDPEAPASSAGWLEAHVKMPLLSWLGRLLGDERHPLHVAAVDRLDLQALAVMTSDPLEMIEIVEETVQHRLTYAFPAGLPVANVVEADRVNVEVIDWALSLGMSAARRLARRVNGIHAETRGDAVRLLLGRAVAEERRERAAEALVRSGLVVAARGGEHQRLSLARAVLEGEDGRIWFQDALDLAAEDRREFEQGRAGGGRAMVENAPAVASLSVDRGEELPGGAAERFEALRQAAEGKSPPATALGAFAQTLQRSRRERSRVARAWERALAADPGNAGNLGGYALFLWEEEHDLDRAQEMFERAIAANPKHANNLGNYASFLRHERRDLDRAQELYECAIAADPKHAINLGNYATCLRDERRDLDRAQELYVRAIAAAPKNAINLGNYASFLRHERRDLDRAQELYERAIDAAPKNAINLGNYATFLREERRHLDRAQELYVRAIAADPRGANSLGNYATFLRHERRDLDRAQELYERAIAANPRDANSLGNYATFLCDERRDWDRAHELFERAIAAAPKDANNLGNFAHLLFLKGNREAAVARLREARALPGHSPALAVELAFYRAVHLAEERADALHDLRRLVAEGARSRGWNFRAHALLAEKAGDADAPLFFAIADVLSAGADPSTLAQFPRWPAP